jgi:hypothetical protein
MKQLQRSGHGEPAFQPARSRLAEQCAARSHQVPRTRLSPEASPGGYWRFDDSVASGDH